MACLVALPQLNREKFFESMNIVARNTGEKMRVNLDLPPSTISHTWTIDVTEDIFQIDFSPTPPSTASRTPPSSSVSTRKRKRSGSNVSLNISFVFEKEINEEDIMNKFQKYHDVFKSLEQLIREYIHDIVNKDPTSKTIEELKTLRTNYEHLLHLLDSIISNHQININSSDQFPILREAFECLKKINDLMNEIPPIEDVIQRNIERKAEHVKCSFLGLEDEVAEYILGRDPDIRDHQPDLYWVMSYMEFKNKSLPEASLTQSFQHLGFSSYRAKFLASLVERNPVADHQTILYWAKLYISTFQQSILFCKNTAQNGATAINVIKTEPRGDDEPIDIEIVHIDEEDIENNGLLNCYKDQNSDKIADTTYWFHGTSKESAKNIAMMGVNLKKGKQNADFSDSEGFYITSNFYFAHNWAQMNHQEAAVVVFKVEKDLFRDGLELSREDSAKWDKVVRYFRNGCKDRKLEYLDEYPYIFGPISKDGMKSQSNPNWKPRFRSDPMGNHLYQICLKDKRLAKMFYKEGQNVEKVLFFC